LRCGSRAEGDQGIGTTAPAGGLAGECADEQGAETPIPATFLLAAMLRRVVWIVLLRGMGTIAVHILAGLAVGRVAVALALALGHMRVMWWLALVRRWRAVLWRATIRVLTGRR
jgi:hypothetical protein